MKIKMINDDLGNSYIADRFKGFITFELEVYNKAISK